MGEVRLSRTPGDRLFRLCKVPEADGRDPADRRGDLACSHLEAGHTEDHMAISTEGLCCCLWRACADEMP